MKSIKKHLILTAAGLTILSASAFASSTAFAADLEARQPDNGAVSSVGRDYRIALINAGQESSPRMQPRQENRFQGQPMEMRKDMDKEEKPAEDVRNIPENRQFRDGQKQDNPAWNKEQPREMRREMDRDDDNKREFRNNTEDRQFRNDRQRENRRFMPQQDRRDWNRDTPRRPNAEQTMEKGRAEGLHRMPVGQEVKEESRDRDDHFQPRRNDGHYRNKNSDQFKSRRHNDKKDFRQRRDSKEFYKDKKDNDRKEFRQRRHKDEDQGQHRRINAPENRDDRD